MQWFHSLPIRRKLTWIILVISGLTLLMAATAIAIFERYDFRRALARDATVLADVAATNVSGALAFDDEEMGRSALRALRSEEHVIAAALYKEDGTLFVDFKRERVTEKLPDRPGEDGARFVGDGLTVVRPVFYQERRLGTIVLRMDLEGITERLLVFAGIIGLILIISLLIAAALTAWLQRPITRPILQLAETAKAFSDRKDFSVRAPRNVGGEIGTLTAAFNEMLDGIEERRSALIAANDQLRLIG